MVLKKMREESGMTEEEKQGWVLVKGYLTKVGGGAFLCCGKGVSLPTRFYSCKYFVHRSGVPQSFMGC